MLIIIFEFYFNVKLNVLFKFSINNLNKDLYFDLIFFKNNILKQQNNNKIRLSLFHVNK
jgi:hypothetical protein